MFVKRTNYSVCAAFNNSVFDLVVVILFNDIKIDHFFAFRIDFDVPTRSVNVFYDLILRFKLAAISVTRQTIVSANVR